MNGSTTASRQCEARLRPSPVGGENRGDAQQHERRHQLVDLGKAQVIGQIRPPPEASSIPTR